MTRAALFALAALTAAWAAADDAPSTKKVDWGAYTDHIKLTGEVKKTTDTGFTLKVLKAVPRGRPATEEIDLAWHENGLVRWAKEPPKLDAKGKKVPYTDKERKELKLPPGSPGYAAEKSDLAVGTAVEVQLLKPKGVAQDKLVSTDYKVKYAVIQDAPPAKDPTKPAETPKKGDKKP